jgi:hypothetical protein
MFDTSSLQIFIKLCGTHPSAGHTKTHPSNTPTVQKIWVADDLECGTSFSHPNYLTFAQSTANHDWGHHAGLLE